MTCFSVFIVNCFAVGFHEFISYHSISYHCLSVHDLIFAWIFIIVNYGIWKLHYWSLHGLGIVYMALLTHGFWQDMFSKFTSYVEFLFFSWLSLVKLHLWDTNALQHPVFPACMDRIQRQFPICCCIEYVWLD